MESDAIQKIYLSDKDTAQFECPKCHKKKEVNVSKYKTLETSIKLNVKCPCGYAYTVSLERRKFHRKETSIPGKFNFCPLFGSDQAGSMTVLDISKGGLRLKMTTTPIFERGDILEVEFNLDNNTRTPIKKQVFVRNIRKDIVNVEFCSFDPTDSIDKALGFYLY